MKQTDHIVDTNKKVTAAEWLFDQIPLEWTIKRSAFDALQQAKAMEKEQSINEMIGLLKWMNKIASETPMRLETDLDDIVEQYYNETYNKNI